MSRSVTATVIEPAAKGRASVLIVEDETDLANMLHFNMEREGYACRTVHAGDAALAAIAEARPELIVLDRMLPGMSGDDVIAQLKREPSTATIPILLLTAKAEESDQLVGFALGAEDYVTKPFSMKVLLARVSALMRRVEGRREEGEVLSVGAIRLSPSQHEVTVDGIAVRLTLTEFKLLHALLKARGCVLSRAQLLDRVFGVGVVVTDRTVDVHITALRKKLRSAARWIQTVRGVGYVLRQP